MMTQLHKLLMNTPDEILTQVRRHEDDQAEGEGSDPDAGSIRLALSTLKQFLDMPGNGVSEIQHSPGSKQVLEEAGSLQHHVSQYIL